MCIPVGWVYVVLEACVAGVGGGGGVYAFGAAVDDCDWFKLGEVFGQEHDCHFEFVEGWGDAARSGYKDSHGVILAVWG